MPPSPWTTRSLPSAYPPLSLHTRTRNRTRTRTRTRLRVAVFVLALLLVASTLYEVCFRQRVVAVEEEEGWKYRVGEELKMGVERMRVEGVEMYGENGGDKEGKMRGGDEDGDGDEEGTLVGASGGVEMYGEEMGEGNGRWIDALGGEASESYLGLRASSRVRTEGGATSVVVEGQGFTLAANKEESVSESRVEDAEIPVTIALHAAESRLVGKPGESQPRTLRAVELSIEAAPVTASHPPLQTPIKLRAEPSPYTVSFSLL